jgi:hypothetical protein
VKPSRALDLLLAGLLLLCVGLAMYLMIRLRP